MDNSETSTNRPRQNQPGSEAAAPNPSGQVEYKMRLFVAGDEPNSVIARRNINEICSVNIQGRCELEIIDVFENFAAAIEESILVTPALIIDKPKKTKIFGNLQERAKVLSVLGLL